MKVVFDTNVLISGFITTTGPSAYALSLAFRRHEVVLSDYILSEFERKLIGKLRFPKEGVRTAVSFLLGRCTQVKLQKLPKIQFSDSKDIPILEMLAVLKPHYFITGDKQLLKMKKQGSTVFLSPREAMEIL